MPFTSYAQNFEDVMLWRALSHVARGRYIDIGAQHPVVDSVSLAFYEKGWRGTHVEPVPQYAELLRAHRPDETVLQLALADREGTLELNLISDTGLTTGVDDYARRHQQERGLPHQKISVPVTTLAAAFGDLRGQDIHWLKIDVEGFETEVLRGWDSQLLRPWILVVEATIPNSMQTDHQRWEHIVTQASYTPVYFDGLNRYYVAAEHPELIPAFGAPPNVFDDILLTEHAPMCRTILQAKLAVESEWEAERTHCNEINANLRTRTAVAEDAAEQCQKRAAHAEQQQRIAETELQNTREKLHLAEQRLTNCRNRIQEMTDSRSWRLTRPLRWLNKKLRCSGRAPAR